MYGLPVSTHRESWQGSGYDDGSGEQGCSHSCFVLLKPADETISLIRQTSANEVFPCAQTRSIRQSENKHISLNQAARTARTEFGGLL
jgi:hypothetical protein